MTLPFGKHKGRGLHEVPLDYLEWLYGLDDLRPRLREAVDREWQARRSRWSYEEEPPRPSARLALPPPVAATARDIVNAGFRSLAHSAHPDHGGNAARMRLLIETREALAALLGAA